MFVSIINYQKIFSWLKKKINFFYKIHIANNSTTHGVAFLFHENYYVYINVYFFNFSVFFSFFIVFQFTFFFLSLTFLYKVINYIIYNTKVIKKKNYN